MSVSEAYKVLGFPQTEVPKQEVDKRYRYMALQMHPDKGGKLEDMQRLNVAKDVIDGYLKIKIKQDVQEQIEEAFNSDVSSIIIQRDGRFFLDLWKANTLILEQAGIKHIEVMGICTGCNTQEWYSHRVEIGNTGRFGALIALTE